MTGGREVHRAGTQVFAVVLIVIGVALIVRTVAAGGGAGALGILLGVLFVAAGGGRLWVARSTR